MTRSDILLFAGCLLLALTLVIRRARQAAFRRAAAKRLLDHDAEASVEWIRRHHGPHTGGALPPRFPTRRR